ncbi:hypothetical protein G5A97_23030 [[Clostridium] symbiosum]|nr:hypothetical protein [[Clostridium] symbiosum]
MVKRKYRYENRIILNGSNARPLTAQIIAASAGKSISMKERLSGIKRYRESWDKSLRTEFCGRGRMNCLILSCRESAVRFSGIIISASLLMNWGRAVSAIYAGNIPDSMSGLTV